MVKFTELASTHEREQAALQIEAIGSKAQELAEQTKFIQNDLQKGFEGLRKVGNLWIFLMSVFWVFRMLFAYIFLLFYAFFPKHGLLLLISFTTLYSLIFIFHFSKKLH